MVRVQGLIVEVPRPSTTAGGTSAVEISTDSLSVAAAPTAEDLLRRMPLVQMRVNSRGEVQPDLRGADDRQIAVLLDGVPLTLGWDHRTDLSVVPLTAVRSVTLLRGLSSMLHGPNVLGGALEFNVGRGRSRPPPAVPFAGSLSLDHVGGVSVGAAAAASVPSDGANWDFRAGAGYRNSPGAPLADEATRRPDLTWHLLRGGPYGNKRLNSDRRLADAFAAVRYQRGESGWVSGLVTALDGRRGIPPEAHVSNPRLWRYPNQTRLLVALSGGIHGMETDRGAGDLEASLGLDRSATEIDEYATPSYERVVDGETGATTTLTGRLLGDYRFRAGPEVRSALTLADVTHGETFADGASFDYEQLLWSLGTELELGGGGNGPGSPSGGSTLWSLGASLDGSSTPRSGDKPALGTMWDWGMRTGITRVGFGGRVVYHAGLSRRTRFPSLREMYSGALGRFLPNPELSPEVLRAGEMGVTISVGESRFQLVGFHQRLGNGIVRTRVVTPEGTLFQRVNRDNVNSTGMELLAAWSRGRINLGGDLTLKRVRVTDPVLGAKAHLAEYEPAASWSVNLGVLGPKAVTVASFLRYRGVQYCQSATIEGLEWMGAGARLDMDFRRVFTVGSGTGARAVATTVGVSNMANDAMMDQCGLPQPGRTLRVQFNVR